MSILRSLVSLRTLEFVCFQLERHVEFSDEIPQQLASEVHGLVCTDEVNKTESIKNGTKGS